MRPRPIFLSGLLSEGVDEDLDLVPERSTAAACCLSKGEGSNAENTFHCTSNFTFIITSLITVLLILYICEILG